MFIKLLIISLILIALAITGLCIKILLKRNGTFPETHIDKNRDMRKLGIKCARNIDIGCDKKPYTPDCLSCKFNQDNDIDCPQ